MAKMSKENIEKLEMLREQLINEGSIIEVERNEKVERVFNEKEEAELKNTMEVWGITKEQAIMIYDSCGSITALNYTNRIRTWQNEKEVSYDRMLTQMKDDKSFIDNVEQLEEKYYKNYEDILSNELTVAEIFLLRNTNRMYEQLLEQRRPQLEQRINRYRALGVTVYYGQIVDHMKEEAPLIRKSEKELEESKLLPNLRIAAANEISI